VDLSLTSTLPLTAVKQALRSLPPHGTKRSMIHVLQERRLHGSQCVPGRPADLLIEVPHGADEAAHFHTLAAALRGPLPAGLEDFFFVNTDVGAWQLGEAVAAEVVRRDPTRSVQLIRCLIPRTFIDANRKPDETGGDLRTGALTPGLQPYIHDAADQQLLRSLHAEYTDAVAEAFETVCGHGGVAFIPHTYGPVSMGIDSVDDDIVTKLHWALAPERADTWPTRPEVDLIHTTADGTSLAPAGLIEDLASALQADGLDVANGHTYYLHPSTMGFAWSNRYPGQVLSLEVRRDLVVEQWTPFAEMTVREAALGPFARPIARALVDALSRR
jgi:hypothetical protein